MGRPKLDLAGAELGVDGSLGPRSDLSADQHHKLRSQRFCRLERLIAPFRGKDHLRLAVAVAEVDEQHAAVVAVGIDPAAERDLLPDMFQTQFAARVSP